LFRKASTAENKIMMWLNFVEIENLENLVGISPKTNKSKKKVVRHELEQ
jgi:hypothetical protein